jgi:medium-chain acyl-[acyl-carrier-protein] hydrolase
MGWARHVSRGLGVWAVQLPGRENRLRERPLSEMSAIVEGTLEALRSHLDVPFALFGHSMGALVAFELARHLRRTGEPAPVRLLVSAQRAPDLPRRRPPIAHLSAPEFVVELRRRYAGVPEAILQQPDLMALFLPCLQADMGLVERYRCDDEPPLECPISAFGGLEDPEATEAELNAWQRHTRSTFSLRRFAGGHFYLRDAGQELLAAMCRDLDSSGDPLQSVALPR